MQHYIVSAPEVLNTIILTCEHTLKENMRKLSLCELNYYNFNAIITLKNDKMLPVLYIKNLLKIINQNTNVLFFP